MIWNSGLGGSAHHARARAGVRRARRSKGMARTGPRYPASDRSPRSSEETAGVTGSVTHTSRVALSDSFYLSFFCDSLFAWLVVCPHPPLPLSLQNAVVFSCLYRISCLSVCVPVFMWLLFIYIYLHFLISFLLSLHMLVYLSIY